MTDITTPGYQFIHSSFGVIESGSKFSIMDDVTVKFRYTLSRISFLPQERKTDARTRRKRRNYS